MNNQIDIFDLLTPDDIKSKDFREMTIEEIADYLGDLLGLKFKYSELFGEYIAKVGKRTLELRLGTYHYHFSDKRNGDPFISCGWLEAGAGQGLPCDSLEEAYNFLRRAKRCK